ncbi:MAG: nicotinate-nucleotide--dimethylbenzimidazole phosphoribosyltransferase [Dehalococcoidia bacterium]|nr:nicotinate-nucleotide--dimethylbenzimidazole phosphoribosyltransferase [Dehalococcoidia bacterium]
MELLQRTIAAIGPPDEAAAAAARQRQDSLTKPPGSLGRLEELSIQLAGITGQIAGITGRSRPRLERAAIIVIAGDHGVTAEGVSAYPAAVTPQMVLNFLRGGAAINVLARHVGARLVVVDMGVAAELPPNPALVPAKVGWGTANMALGPAMSRAQAVQALETGIGLVEQEAARGLDLMATGDMGIGNTTTASAITAVICGCAPELVTGRGTGVDDAGLARKVAVIRRALQVNRPDPTDGLDVLAKVGGFEIGGMAGVVLAAASRRTPVVLDGFIAGAAALIAVALCPGARPYLIAGHRSVEAGHAVALKHLRLRPLLDLELRLGEGTGAALAIPIVQAAARILDEMATFGEAGVSGKSSG